MTDQSQDRLVVDPLPGYEPEIGRLLWMFNESRQRTKSWLNDLPDEDHDWTPAPGFNSIATIFYHLAAIEADWLYFEILEEKASPSDVASLFPDDVRDDEGRLTAARASTLESYLDRLEAVRTHVLAAFRDMSLAEFHRQRELSD